MCLRTFFFGLLPIFGKLGVENVSSALALGIRGFVISGIMLAWRILDKNINHITDVSMASWTFIALEGICTAIIGQFFYYYALKSGDASKVVPIIASFPLFALN